MSKNVQIAVTGPILWAALAILLWEGVRGMKEETKEKIYQAGVAAGVFAVVISVFFIFVDFQAANVGPRHYKLQTHECDDYFGTRNWSWSVVYDGHDQCCLEHKINGREVRECYTPKEELDWEGRR